MKRIVILLLTIFALTLSLQAQTVNTGDGKIHVNDFGRRNTYTIAGLPTCNAANVEKTVSVSDGNKGQRTCRNTTGSTYAWVDDRPVFDVTSFGARPSATAATNNAALDAAVIAASAGDIIAVPPGVFQISTEWVITKALTITGKGTLQQITSGKGAIDVQASNVTIETVTLVGSQYSAQVVSEKAIKAYAPSWAGRYSNLTVENVTMHTWGGYGVDVKWIEGVKVNDNAISNIRYAGISILSCAKGEAQRNRIDNITDTPNAYGIAFSRDETDSLITDPHATDFDCSGNIISNVPNWEGIDAHGGTRISLHHNTVTGCKVGIQVGASDNAANVATFPPIDVTIDTNTIDSKVTDGSAGVGIIFSGVSSPASDAKKATGKITNNTVRGHGQQSSTGSAGVIFYSTLGLIVSGNTVIEPSPRGFDGAGGEYNTGLIFTNNTVVDAWSNTVGVGEGSFAILNGATNSGSLAGNKLVTSSKSATYKNTIGIRYGSTGSTWNLGINDFAAAATLFVIAGTPTVLNGTVEGAIVQASNDDFIQRKSGAWANRTVAQVKADLDIAAVVTSITGTANQVIVTGTTTPTLSLPQSIATSSTVRFQSIGIGGAASYPFQIVDTVSSNGSFLYSMRGRAFNVSTTSAGHFMEANSFATISRPAATTTNSGYTYGFFSEAYLDSGAAGTLATQAGFVSRSYIDSSAVATAAITTAYGLKAEVANNKAGATLTTGYAVHADSTSAGGTITNAYDFYGANASAKNYLAGGVTFDATITAGGTTGARTIDKASGTVNLAAAATSVIVTNNKVTTSSLVFAQARTNDATCAVRNVVPDSGSFTINMTAACTAETSVGFVVH